MANIPNKIDETPTPIRKHRRFPRLSLRDLDSGEILLRNGTVWGSWKEIEEIFQGKNDIVLEEGGHFMSLEAIKPSLQDSSQGEILTTYL